MEAPVVLVGDEGAAVRRRRRWGSRRSTRFGRRRHRGRAALLPRLFCHGEHAEGAHGTGDTLVYKLALRLARPSCFLELMLTPVLLALAPLRSRASSGATTCTTTPSSWRWRARSPPRRTPPRSRRGRRARPTAGNLRRRLRADAPSSRLTSVRRHAALQEALRGGEAISGEAARGRREGAETDATEAILSATGRRGRKRRRRTTTTTTTTRQLRVAWGVLNVRSHADVCLGLGARAAAVAAVALARPPRRRAPGDGAPGRRKPPRRRRR